MCRVTMRRYSLETNDESHVQHISEHFAKADDGARAKGVSKVRCGHRPMTLALHCIIG